MSAQDDLYIEAAQLYGAALQRLARAYEADSEKQHDLLQEIHFAIWRSLEKYEARCTLRTWVYRVAHNTAASHVMRQRRTRAGTLLSLAEIDAAADGTDLIRQMDDRAAIERLYKMIHRLKPLDRNLMLLYLEDLDAPSIAEITGLSPGAVRVQIHRIKTLIIQRFQRGNIT